MKTRNVFNLAIILFAVVGLSITGCKKEETDTNSLQQLSKDEQVIQSSTDDVLNDVNTVLSEPSKSVDALPCNVTVDSISIVSDTAIAYVTFNGLNCNGTINRVGKITIKRNVNTSWNTAGTKVIVTLINLQLTKNGKSVTLNGVKTFENVSGGRLIDLGTTYTSIVHKVTGYVQATFDDNTTRKWNIARQRTFTGTPTNLVVTVDGFGSADGYNNLVVWGTNRNGEAFYTQITQSVVFKQSCGWDPTSGVKIHQIPSDEKTAIVTFGYGDDNQLVSGDNCPTRYKVDWEKGTQSGTIYLQLP